jgi:ABC-type amino acid transport substrate-binding protein
VVVTPERQQRADFTVPIATEVKEIVVTGAGGPKLNSLDDLGGQTVYANPFTVQYNF